MLDGIASHALDFDDTHTEAILHASAILTPLCLSYGFHVSKDAKNHQSFYSRLGSGC